MDNTPGSTYYLIKIIDVTSRCTYATHATLFLSLEQQKYINSRARVSGIKQAALVKDKLFSGVRIIGNICGQR